MLTAVACLAVFHIVGLLLMLDGMHKAPLAAEDSAARHRGFRS